MLRTIFGDVRDGRVARLRFLVALLVLTAAGMAVMLGLLWFSGVAGDAAALDAGAEEFGAAPRGTRPSAAGCFCFCYYRESFSLGTLTGFFGSLLLTMPGLRPLPA